MAQGWLFVLAAKLVIKFDDALIVCFVVDWVIMVGIFSVFLVLQGAAIY